MRSIISLAAAILALLFSAAPAQRDNVFDGAVLGDPKTRDLMTSARIAIFGGPGGLARLQSMRFKGRSRFPATDGTLVSAAVEVRVRSWRTVVVAIQFLLQIDRGLLSL
jgi:hypothetical protein